MPAEFIWKRQVQFAETDLAGVMHFANYFRWMEECEHAFWRSLGTCVITTDGGRQISWPRVSVTCDYSAPARFQDELELRLKVAKVGARSLTFEITFDLDGERVAVGKVTAVCCATARDSFQPIDIPDNVRTLLEKN